MRRAALLVACLVLAGLAVPGTASAGWWRAAHADTHPGYDPGIGWRTMFDGNDSNGSLFDHSAPNLGDGHAESMHDLKHAEHDLHVQVREERDHYLHLWHVQEVRRIAHERRDRRCRGYHAMYEIHHPFGKPNDLRTYTGCRLWEADAAYHEGRPAEPVSLLPGI